MDGSMAACQEIIKHNKYWMSNKYLTSLLKYSINISITHINNRYFYEKRFTYALRLLGCNFYNGTKIWFPSWELISELCYP